MKNLKLDDVLAAVAFVVIIWASCQVLIDGLDKTIELENKRLGITEVEK